MKKEVISGKLKLKKTISKRKPKETSTAHEPKESISMAPSQMHIPDNSFLHKTPAELRYEKAMKARLPRRINETLKKTHREKIDEYNKKLAKLPEHFDIPRIGPG